MRKAGCGVFSAPASFTAVAAISSWLFLHGELQNSHERNSRSNAQTSCICSGSTTGSRLHLHRNYNLLLNHTVGQKIMAISAWDSFSKKESPDGRFIATYDDAMEIAMGAPTRGVIKISEKKDGAIVTELGDANGSFVWSADSTSLAFPRWTRSRMQQIVIVTLPQGKTESLEGEYRVLELESFDHDLIQGIDSPIHRPSKVSVSAKK